MVYTPIPTHLPTKRVKRPFFVEKNNGGGEGELSSTVCFSKEVNQRLINGDMMGSYLVSDGYRKCRHGICHIDHRQRSGRWIDRAHVKYWF